MVSIFATASALLTPEFVDSFEPEKLASKFVKVEKEYGVKFNKTESTFNIVGEWQAVRGAHRSLQQLDEADRLSINEKKDSLGAASVGKLCDKNGASGHEGLDTCSDQDSESKENYEDIGRKSILKTKGNPKRGRHAKETNKDSMLPEPVVFFQYQDLTFEDEERLNMDTVIDDYERSQVNKKVTKSDLKKIFEKNTDQMGRPLLRPLPRAAQLPPKKQTVFSEPPPTSYTECGLSSPQQQYSLGTLPTLPSSQHQYFASNADVVWMPRSDEASLASTELANMLSYYSAPQMSTECKTYDSGQVFQGTDSSVVYSASTSISDVSSRIINSIHDPCTSNNSILSSSAPSSLPFVNAVSFSSPFFQDSVQSKLTDITSNIDMSLNVSSNPTGDNSAKILMNDHNAITGSIVIKDKSYNAGTIIPTTDNSANILMNDHNAVMQLTAANIEMKDTTYDAGVMRDVPCEGVSVFVTSQHIKPNKIQESDNLGLSSRDSELNLAKNEEGKTEDDDMEADVAGSGDVFVSAASCSSGIVMSTLTTVCNLPDMSVEGDQPTVTESQDISDALKSSDKAHCSDTGNKTKHPTTSERKPHAVKARTKPLKKLKPASSVTTKDSSSVEKKVRKTTKAKQPKVTAKKKVVVDGTVKSKKTKTGLETKPDDEKQSTNQVPISTSLQINQDHNNVSSNNTSNAIEAVIKPDKDGLFKCPECDYGGKRRKRLTEHMGRVHGLLTGYCRGTQEKTTFPCDQCDKTFVFGKDLNRHKKIVHHGLVHYCTLCNKSYKAKYVFDKHIATHEAGYVQPMFPCQICDRQFTTKFSLGTHVKSEHLGLKKTFICPTCGKSFSQIRSYRQHANVHAGIRPYVCEICNKSFTYDKSLKEHRYMHDNMRRFPCTVCGKAFRQRTCLLIHMKVHKDSKDHICSSCGKGFTQKQSLLRHERIHTGDKPYTCKLCNKSFGDYAVIRKHMLMSHKRDKDSWKSDIIAEQRKQSDHYVSGGPGYVPRDMSIKTDEESTDVSVRTDTVAEVLTGDAGRGTLMTNVRETSPYITSQVSLKPGSNLVSTCTSQTVPVPVALYNNVGAVNFITPSMQQLQQTAVSVVSGYDPINEEKGQNMLPVLNTNTEASLASVQVGNNEQQFSSPANVQVSADGSLSADDLMMVQLLKQQSRQLQMSQADGSLPPSLLSPVSMATMEQVAAQGLHNQSPYLIKNETTAALPMSTNVTTTSENSSSWNQNFQVYYDTYQFPPYQNQPDP